MANERKSPRPNDVIRCEICNEDYSVTYKRCPFCDEAPPKVGRRGGGTGRRVSNRRGGGYGGGHTPIQIVGLVITLALIVTAFFIVFKWISPFFSGNPAGSSTSGSQTQPEGSQSTPEGDTSANQPDDQTLRLNYPELALAEGESIQLSLVGLSEEEAALVTWLSADDGVVQVAEDGTLTYQGEGRALVSGEYQGEAFQCVVTCAAPTGGTDGGTTTDGTTPGTTTGGGTTTPGSTASGDVVGKTGTITGAGGGLRIRSGPGTSYDVLATITNGKSVTVKAVEGEWYQILYSGTGGKDSLGYVKAEYVSFG